MRRTSYAGVLAADRRAAPSPEAPAAAAALGAALARAKDFQSGMCLGAGYRRGPGISAGADGDVFRALTEVGAVDVAIKRMRLSSAAVQRHAAQELSVVFFARQRYAQDARLEACIGHPNIVAYLDWFAGPGEPSAPVRELFLVMEYCEFAISDMVYTAAAMRTQYERRVNDHRRALAAKSRTAIVTSAIGDQSLFRFTEREVVKIAWQMLAALAFLNRCGILHRDIKADNILWAPGPSEGSYKLADFGVAVCLAEGQQFASDKGSGTLWTMAPEVLAGRPHGPTCDVWSLGVVLFEAAILERPFNSKELLAYKGSYEAASEGSFWSSMCGGFSGPSAGSSPGSRPATPTKVVVQVPASPAARARRCPPTPPSRSPKVAAATAAVGMLAVSGAGRRTAPGTLLTTVGPPSPAPATEGGACVGSRQAGHGTNKNAFLKKRCLTRWFYSADLRGLLFDDMLDEDARRRPTAAALLGDARLTSLAAAVGVTASGAPCGESAAAMARIQFPKVVDSTQDAEGDGSSPPTAAAPTAASTSDAAAASQGATLSLVLRQVTGEAFYAATKLEIVSPGGRDTSL